MRDLVLDRQQIIDALKKANSIQDNNRDVFWTDGISDNDQLQHLSTADLLQQLIFVLNDDLHKVDFNKVLHISRNID